MPITAPASRFAYGSRLDYVNRAVMKRTAVSIVLAVAALAMLSSLVSQSRSLPLEVHLSQSAVSSEIERVGEDFAALIAMLEAARRENQEPAEAASALLGRIATSPVSMGPMLQPIPAGASQRNRLDSTLEGYSRSVAQLEELARHVLAEQQSYASNVAFVREEGPRMIQQMRELRLDAEAADVFQLVVGALDFAAPDGTMPAAELRRLLTTLRRDQRIDANIPRELERLSSTVVALVEGKEPLESGLRQLASLPLTQRAAAVGAASRDAYRGAVEGVEQARLMLSIYSVALLVIIGFAAFRLQASYRALNRSHAELAQLNESLEQRVAERTKELAGTLKDLKESQVQLVQAEKMSSLGQLVAGISHEINTPLLYLANNAVLIQERLNVLREFVGRCGAAFKIRADDFADRNAFQAEFVGALREVKKMLRQEDIEASLQEAEDLAQDCIEGLADLTDMAQSLKDFSRLDRAPVARFDVNSGLDKTLTIARNVIKHKAEVRKFYGEVPEIECSPSQINQVFLNLLTNAAQAIEERGEIVITTKRQSDDRVAISIADNGCGIPAQLIDKIRDPFFTTKAVGCGTGLGLSIVDEIVRSHDGELMVESQVGRGSVFTVVLPIRRSGSGAGATAADEALLAELDALDEQGHQLAEAV
jgi:two-component system, NtrC family, sensor kinase